MNKVYEPVWGKMYLKIVKRETMKEKTRCEGREAGKRVRDER